jgi:hypothetical protein
MKLKRVCLHWTAGGLIPNATDRRHYNFIVDHTGRVHRGIYPPEANARQLSNNDTYAMHCAGGNSFTLGVAVCGGGRGHRHGEFTRKSLESACEWIARFCLMNQNP